MAAAGDSQDWVNVGSEYDGKKAGFGNIQNKRKGRVLTE
ncbi:homeobox protein aristaless-like 4 isoform X2 [Prionailurus iriomotensis]